MLQFGCVCSPIVHLTAPFEMVFECLPVSRSFCRPVLGECVVSLLSAGSRWC